MKGYIYLIFGLAFIIFFQKQPYFAFTMIVLAILYFYYKNRRKIHRSNSGIFRSNRVSQFNKQDQLINFFIIQQILNSLNEKSNQLIEREREDSLQIEKTKKEILQLLKGD